MRITVCCSDTKVAPWIEGLLLQWIHGEGGHLSYLFGRTG